MSVTDGVDCLCWDSRCALHVSYVVTFTSRFIVFTLIYVTLKISCTWFSTLSSVKHPLCKAG